MSEMDVIAVFEKMIFTVSLWFSKTWGKFLSQVLIQVIIFPACVIVDKFLTSLNISK